jgi:hypothetical protein
MHFDRFRAIATLPADGGWRADLAIDRSATPPRAVLVSRVPGVVTGDAIALSQLARGIDLATRAAHPALRRLYGTGELDGDLVLVEAWREGETLRAVLDACGPLAPALVARVGVEVAGALQACQAIPAAGGRPLAHGGVRSERILLAEDGAVLLCATGRPFTEEPSLREDLRALARALLECLPPSSGEAQAALVAVIDRALEGEGLDSAAEFAAGLSAAVEPAGPEAVAALAEAAQPEGTPAWLSRRRALAQALRAEEGAAADEVAAPPLGAPPSPRPPGPPPSVSPPPPSTPPATTPPPLRARREDRPVQTPPPLPAMRLSLAQAAPALSGIEPGIEPADREPADREPADQFYEAEPGAAASPTVPPGAPAQRGWTEHPRAPTLVMAGAGLLGLVLGLLLGGRR